MCVRGVPVPESIAPQETRPTDDAAGRAAEPGPAQGAPSAPAEAAMAWTWRRAIAVWAGLVGLLIVAQWGTAQSMVGVWWASVTFNHCFLIPVISAWLVWERRSALARLTPRPSWWGVLGIFGASVVWIGGWLLDVALLQHLGLVLGLQFSVLAALGWTVGRVLLFPVAYLLFMVPAGQELVPPLQDLTAVVTVAGLEMLDIPVYSDGRFITVPGGNFEVAEACSGVRYLIASLALGTLFAHVAFRSWKRRAIVVALSIAVPVVANGIRALGIVLIAYWSDMKYAVGVDHLVYGWLFFSVITLVLLAIGISFSDRPIGDLATDDDAAEDDRRPPAPRRPLALLAAAYLAVLAAPAYVWAIEDAVPVVPLEAMAPPSVGADWSPAAAAGPPWRPKFVNVDNELLANFRREGRDVQLYVGFYRRQRPGAELIQHGNQVSGPAPWGLAGTRARTVALGGDTVRVGESRQVAGALARTTWKIYLVGGQISGNRYAVKLRSGLAKLSGGRQDAVVIVVSTLDQQTLQPSADVLAAFLNDLESPVAYADRLSRGGAE